MSTPESHFYNSLNPDEQERAGEMIGIWRGLTLTGCDDCSVAKRTNSVLDIESEPFDKGNMLFRLQHYSIELSGLKRPPVNSQQLDYDHTDEYEERCVFEIAERLGIQETDFQEFSNEFLGCLVCPVPLNTTGATPTFEEIREAFRPSQEK